MERSDRGEGGEGGRSRRGVGKEEGGERGGGEGGRGGWEGERGDGALKYMYTCSYYISIHMSLHEGKVPHTQNSPHILLTLCPLHTREHDRKRHWVHPKIHSRHSDGQPVHPYKAGAAHTHHAPHVMPPSVEYLHSVKISAYHTNVPYNIQPNPSGSQTSVKRRGWEGEDEGEGDVMVRGRSGGVRRVEESILREKESSQ